MPGTSSPSPGWRGWTCGASSSGGPGTPVRAAFSVLARTGYSRAELTAHTGFGVWELWVIRHLVEPFERVVRERRPEVGTAHSLMVEAPQYCLDGYVLDGYVLDGELRRLGVIDVAMCPGTAPRKFKRHRHGLAWAPGRVFRGLKYSKSCFSMAVAVASAGLRPLTGRSLGLDAGVARVMHCRVRIRRPVARTVSSHECLQRRGRCGFEEGRNGEAPDRVLVVRRGAVGPTQEWDGVSGTRVAHQSRHAATALRRPPPVQQNRLQ